MSVERALAKEIRFGVGRYCPNHRRPLRASQHCGNVLLDLSLHLGSHHEVHPRGIDVSQRVVPGVRVSV